MSVSASVSACLALRQTLEGENMGKAAMGPALVPGKEQGASARAGKGREEQASKREGTLQGWRGGGRGMYCTMSLVMLRSAERTSPRTGQHILKLCTYLVSASHQATVRTTARDWNGTCLDSPKHMHPRQRFRWVKDDDRKRARTLARKRTHMHPNVRQTSQTTSDSLHRQTVVVSSRCWGGCIGWARLQNLKSMHARTERCKQKAVSCERASCDRG